MKTVLCNIVDSFVHVVRFLRTKRNTIQVMWLGQLKKNTNVWAFPYWPYSTLATLAVFIKKFLKKTDSQMNDESWWNL